MKIYLAVPYSHPFPVIRKKRFEAANQKAADLMAKGHIVFSPISHSHPIAIQCSMPLGFDFWEKFDRSFIEWCDEVWIMTLDGWKKSDGIEREIKIAKELNKPVRYI